MMGDKTLRVPGTTRATIRFSSYKSGTRGDHDGRQELASSRDPPAPQSGSQAARRETRGDHDGRQELASSRDPPHYPLVPKLQEGRQEEIMMGDKNLRVPGTPSTTIRLPSYTSYKKEDKGIMMGNKNLRYPQHHHPAPKLHKLQEGRQQEIMMGDKTWRFRHNYKFLGTNQELQQTVWGTRGEYEGRQIGRRARDPGTPFAAHSGSPAVEGRTRGNYEGKQIGRHARDPGTPPAHSGSPAVRYRTRDNYEGETNRETCQAPRTLRFPRSKQLDKRRV